MFTIWEGDRIIVGTSNLHLLLGLGSWNCSLGKIPRKYPQQMYGLNCVDTNICIYIYINRVVKYNLVSLDLVYSYLFEKSNSCKS